MPEDRFVQLNDLRLHVREWGTAGQPLLVLLHGLASTCHMFDLVAPWLSEAYFVVAPDQRGHGLSDKPNSGYDFETIAGDLDRLLDTYGAEQALIGGHSWGAYSTLYYAATRSERVDKAILIDGGVRPLGEQYPTWDAAEPALSPPTYANLGVQDMEQWIKLRWLADAYQPELLPLALSVFDTSDPKNVHAHLSREQHMRIARALWEFRPSDYFARVQCPVLVVNAIAPGQPVDALVERATRDAKQATPQARVVWMPETIHDIPWQRPLELATLIERFLRETA